jgi:hypothetical protein
MAAAIFSPLLKKVRAEALFSSNDDSINIPLKVSVTLRKSTKKDRPLARR